MTIRALQEAFEGWRDEGLPLVLATVYETRGSTYSKAGARMLVTGDGRFQGMLSGGCLEGDLAERACAVLESGEPQTASYDLGGHDEELWGLGVGCDGLMRIFLQPLLPDHDYQPFRAMTAVYAGDTPAAALTVISSTAGPLPPGATLLLHDTRLQAFGTGDSTGDSHRAGDHRPGQPGGIDPGGRPGDSHRKRPGDSHRKDRGQAGSQPGDSHCDSQPGSQPGDSHRDDPDRYGNGHLDRLRALAAETLASGSAGLRTLEIAGGQVEVLAALVSPPPRILVLGAGLDAGPVLRLLRELGWRVTVQDHRPAYLAGGQFDEADRVLCQPAERLSGALDLSRFDAAIVMSHHLASDRVYLRQLAGTGIPYVGLLGPRHRKERLLEDLGDAGKSLAPRLHGPAGLDIGADGPASIALSIVAELHERLRSGARQGMR